MEAYKNLAEEVIPRFELKGMILIDFENRKLIFSEGPAQKEHYVSDRAFRKMVQDAFHNLLLEEDIPRFNEALQKLIDSEIGEPVELICRSNEGEEGMRWVYMQSMLLEKAEDGRPLKAVWCGKDVTRIKLLERKLKDKVDKLETLEGYAKDSWLEPMDSILELVKILREKKYGSNIDQLIIQHLEKTIQSLHQRIRKEVA